MTTLRAPLPRASVRAPRTSSRRCARVVASVASSTTDAPLDRARVAAVAASVSLAIATPAAHAETVREMYVAAGNYSFLEKEYNDLKYAGVKTVVPGLASGVDAADPTPVQALRVTYDADQIEHEALMRVFWQHSDPTNAAGQFKEIGPQYRAAVWVSGAAERAEVERNAARLESSGIFGKGKSIALPILDAPPASFEDAPEDARRVLVTNPKLVEKEAKVRSAAFKDLWGCVQFCADKVCGYVRFAPKCTDDCLDVFPQYRTRNSGVPELTGDNVKITGGSK